MSIELVEVAPPGIRHLATIQDHEGDIVVWWYGAVRKNPLARSLPLVAVWFRELLPDRQWGNFVRRDVGITDLGILQIGTVWRQGRCSQQLRLERRSRHVNLTAGHWKSASQVDHFRDFDKALIPAEAYQLRFPKSDRSRVLVFEHSKGQTLVPALEFFSRLYGRSGEVKRVLTTYLWHEVEVRLGLAADVPSKTGRWSVFLPSRTNNGDATFLAHLRNDPLARRVAQTLNAGLEARFSADADALVFPDIHPWHTGPAELIVEGVCVDASRFLALRIVGGTEPAGKPIDAYRENPGKAGRPASADAPLTSWHGQSTSRASLENTSIDYTVTDEPDHREGVRELPTAPFVVLGRRRDMVVHRLEEASTLPRPPSEDAAAARYAAGERYGADRGTGYGAFHTETVLHSEGALLDVWNALRMLHQAHKTIVRRVGFYDGPESGFVWDEELPRLVRQCGVTNAEGVLVACVDTPVGKVVLFEIERHLVLRTDEEGCVHMEESCSAGVVLRLDSSEDLHELIPNVLEVHPKSAKAILQAARSRPGLHDTYRRSASAGDSFRGHSTVIVALGKVGVHLPRAPATIGASALAAAKEPAAAGAPLKEA